MENLDVEDIYFQPTICHIMKEIVLIITEQISDRIFSLFADKGRPTRWGNWHPFIAQIILGKYCLQ